jgi:hypothetical protein
VIPAERARNRGAIIVAIVAFASCATLSDCSRDDGPNDRADRIAAAMRAVPTPTPVPTAGCARRGPALCNTYPVSAIGQSGVPRLSPSQRTWLHGILSDSKYRHALPRLRFVPESYGAPSSRESLPLIVFDAGPPDEQGDLRNDYPVIGGGCNLGYHPDEDAIIFFPRDPRCGSFVRS